MPVNEKLMEIVVCPKCKGPLDYKSQENAFDCHACKLRYLVEDDIPNFLIDEAVKLDEDD